MGKKHFFEIITIVVVVFVNTSCKKDKSCENCNGSNKPPTAMAGVDQVITLPVNSVILDGSASTDPDGTISGWHWSKISGPSSFSIQQETLSVTTVQNLVAGIYKFELKVTDDAGLTDRDTLLVIVDAVLTQNHPPVANAGPDQTIQLPLNSISLDGSGSSDVDNNISSYRWTKIEGPSVFTITTPTAVQTTVTTLVAGTYKFELEVTDAGNLSAKDTMQVIVNSAGTTNRPPIANAGPDKTINLPLNNITLDGSGSSDPDNNISSFQWSKISGPSSFTIATPDAVQTTVTNLVIGTYMFELKVTDNLGLADKDTIQVIVGSAVTSNQPPVANAGPDKTIDLPVNIITLDGSGSSDPDNNISSFQWTKISGPSSFTITTPAAVQTAVTNLVGGFYEFELKVTDATGAWSKDTIKVAVHDNSHEVIFNNLTWIPIWYETLEINNFYSFIPTGTPFRVYIQRDSNPIWIEATPVANDGSGGSYEYFVETRPDGAGMYTYGSLYVFGYGTDFSDTPNVKIVF